MRFPTRFLIHTAVLIFTLAAFLGKTPAAAADSTTSTSDLAITVVSTPPTRAKACDTFEAEYSIKNLGPDNAHHVSVSINLPDPYEVTELSGVPTDLAVGQSVTIKTKIKVVAFVPGESRNWWVGASASSDPYPNVSVDPNPDNDWANSKTRLVGKQMISCP